MAKIQWKKSEGLISYEEALEFMETRVNQIIEGKEEEVIWFLEHDDIYTAGTSASKAELLSNEFPIYESGRGGKYTYHGPGQRIVYFILNLKRLFKQPDLRQYIYLLEEIIIETLREWNIDSFRRSGRVGIWVEKNNIEKKIAAIGIRIRKWVSFHGIAVNIHPNLDNYSGIVPCGIKEYGITSLADLGINCDLKQFDQALEINIKKFLDIK
jgi:lipoyl(octanoyl) transferase